jgi:hypothetical protein
MRASTITILIAAIYCGHQIIDAKKFCDVEGKDFKKLYSRWFKTFKKMITGRLTHRFFEGADRAVNAFFQGADKLCITLADDLTLLNLMRDVDNNVYLLKQAVKMTKGGSKVKIANPAVWYYHNETVTSLRALIDGMDGYNLTTKTMATMELWYTLVTGDDFTAFLENEAETARSVAINKKTFKNAFKGFTKLMSMGGISLSSATTNALAAILKGFKKGTSPLTKTSYSAWNLDQNATIGLTLENLYGLKSKKALSAAQSDCGASGSVQNLAIGAFLDFSDTIGLLIDEVEALGGAGGTFDTELMALSDALEADYATIEADFGADAISEVSSMSRHVVGGHLWMVC